MNEMPPTAELFAVPCKCWSCDGQCGGTDAPGSCGRTVPTWRGPICLACRERADVFDDDRTAARATVSMDRVRLDVDVFSHPHSSMWLDLQDVDMLIGALRSAKRQLERDREHS